MKLKLMLPLKTLADTLKRGHRTLGFFEIPRVWCPAFRLRPLILPVLAGLLAMWAEPAARADYTWTNTANGTSGFWTNGNLWATPANYPGSNAIDNAYLTNDTTAGATYTNILNFNLPKSLGTLAISNGAGGNAWLIVTNNAAGTGVGLTNATFILGNGGGLEIDSGGLFTNTTTFNWSGTNGVINLNNNGTLITAAAVTIGSSASSITGLVTSTSSAGQGGTWKLNGQSLAIGNAGSFDVLTVNNVTLTNGGLVTVGSAGGGFNTMTVTNANVWSTGLTIGNGSSNNTVNILGNTVWNLLGNTVTIGSGAATGNVLSVTGGVLTNVATITSTSAGGGTLVNNGNLWGGSGLTVTNAMIDTSGTNNITGTWTLQGGSPGILLLRSNSLLRAATTATITGAGQITTTGPANLEVDSGTLTISTSNTSFNVKSLVISNGATLSFAGIGTTNGWQGSMTAAGNLTVGNATSLSPGCYLSLAGDVDENLGRA